MSANRRPRSRTESNHLGHDLGLTQSDPSFVRCWLMLFGMTLSQAGVTDIRIRFISFITQIGLKTHSILIVIDTLFVRTLFSVRARVSSRYKQTNKQQQQMFIHVTASHRHRHIIYGIQLADRVLHATCRV